MERLARHAVERRWAIAVLFERLAGLPDRPQLDFPRAGLDSTSGKADHASEAPPASTWSAHNPPLSSCPPFKENTVSQTPITQALQRVQSVFSRRPEAGLHDDTPATAQWTNGMRVVVRHANGTALPSDMPTEFGGAGDEVTPGWFFRAGLASCATTSITMAAALQGVNIEALEVRAESRSDARGMFAMADADGRQVPAGPLEVSLTVRIVAPGESTERLRAFVEKALGSSPIPSLVRSALPLSIRVETA